ncbi:MAG: DNA mismatch repair protein MutS [Kofleriaceae bacterium]|nr:DNA mismatch repair protein MutS [Kofleriaceae bacterium]
MARRSPSDTPLMRQFLQDKEQHPTGILFFRMGDFYEMFFEDAVVAAKALDLTLTSRDKGKPDAVPMCGLPHHAGRGYIARLTEQGFKVVICEQVEDPKTAKGLVKREVVQIVTPGVVVDDEVLDPKTARYLAAVCPEAKGPRWGLAYLDVSTGEFRCTEVDSLAELAAELTRVMPREILAGHEELKTGSMKRLSERFTDTAYTGVVRRSEAEGKALLQSALAGSLDELGLGQRPLAAAAAADALQYARETQPTGTLPISRIQVYQTGESVILDEAAVSNLELTQTLMGGKKAGSLLSVLDSTKTASGGRLLRRWLLYPLLDVGEISLRHDSVEYLIGNASLRTELRSSLKEMYDMERLAGRLSLGVASPRDMGRLRWTLQRLPELAKLLGTGNRKKSQAVPAPLALDAKLLKSLRTVCKKLEEVLIEEPPLVTKDGGMIVDGYCPIIDENRALATGGKDSILAIENRERKATGIPKLRVKYNRVFGYYIEVSRGSIDKVPKHYVRKQTVAAAERYVTTELAELETKILSAQDALVTRELEVFRKLCAESFKSVQNLLTAGQQIACVDALASLAEVAHNSGYVRPVVDESEILDIRDGRHPVVERMVPDGEFVPNTCRVDTEESQLLLITGPNMSGKSTYMRQVAHIVLMAQMGSFVPAESARVGVVDRVFTRVGAADNLARGESTFMVEMRETAAILSGATRRSLVILDEVGRGTSTFDGVSIAWAVSEFLHDAIGARTLFATHYHELARLSDMRPRVKNLSVAVSEVGGKIVFLRQVVEGSADRSYGIDVARLAGLPRSVISRSRQILAELERGQLNGESSQLSLFAAVSAPAPTDASSVEENLVSSEVRDKLADVDPNQMTPMQALAMLVELKALAADSP